MLKGVLIWDASLQNINRFGMPLVYCRFEPGETLCKYIIGGRGAVIYYRSSLEGTLCKYTVAGKEEKSQKLTYLSPIFAEQSPSN
jgi:hypothetical protein